MRTNLLESTGYQPVTAPVLKTEKHRVQWPNESTTSWQAARMDRLAAGRVRPTGGLAACAPQTWISRRWLRETLLVFVCAILLSTAPEDGRASDLLTGKAAMGDWAIDAPGVRRKITVADLAPPSSNVLAINPPRVVSRPANANLNAPPGFKINLLASGFRDPRFLLSAPNGDIFVVESRPDQIKVIRGAHAETVDLFAETGLNKPFGIALYPPGDDPQISLCRKY